MSILKPYRDAGVLTFTVQNNEAIADNPYENPNIIWDTFSQSVAFQQLAIPPLPTSGIPDGTVKIEDVEEQEQWKSPLNGVWYEFTKGAYPDTPTLKGMNIKLERRFALIPKALRKAQFPEGLDFETLPTQEEAEAGNKRRRAIQAENLEALQKGEEEKPEVKKLDDALAKMRQEDASIETYAQLLDKRDAIEKIMTKNALCDYTDDKDGNRLLTFSPKGFLNALEDFSSLPQPEKMEQTAEGIETNKYLFDKVNQRKATFWFNDIEGNFYINADPHGVQMSGKITIIPIGTNHHQYEIREEYSELQLAQYKERLLVEIPKILEGIDTDEVANEEGWWETSTGAKFGAAKLKQLLDLIKI